MKKFKLINFILIAFGLIIISTIFLFPSSEPGAVVNLNSGKILSEPDIIKLSPIFGNRSKKIYSFTLSPNLEEYTHNVSSNENIALMSKTVTINDNGSTSSDWSFAWHYWLLFLLVPCTLISFVITWISGRSTQKEEIDQTSGS